MTSWKKYTGQYPGISLDTPTRMELGRYGKNMYDNPGFSYGPEPKGFRMNKTIPSRGSSISDSSSEKQVESRRKRRYLIGAAAVVSLFVAIAIAISMGVYFRVNQMWENSHRSPTPPPPRGETDTGFADFLSQIKISSQLWDPALLNKNNDAFQRLAYDVEKEMDAIMILSTLKEIYNYSVVNSFRQGSVVANISTIFKAETENLKQVVQILKDKPESFVSAVQLAIVERQKAVSAGTVPNSGNLPVFDRTSITVESVKRPTTTTSTTTEATTTTSTTTEAPTTTKLPTTTTEETTTTTLPTTTTEAITATTATTSTTSEAATATTATTTTSTTSEATTATTTSTTSEATTATTATTSPSTTSEGITATTATTSEATSVMTPTTTSTTSEVTTNTIPPTTTSTTSEETTNTIPPTTTSTTSEETTNTIPPTATSTTSEETTNTIPPTTTSTTSEETTNTIPPTTTSTTSEETTNTIPPTTTSTTSEETTNTIPPTATSTTSEETTNTIPPTTTSTTSEETTNTIPPTTTSTTSEETTNTIPPTTTSTTSEETTNTIPPTTTSTTSEETTNTIPPTTTSTISTTAPTTMTSTTPMMTTKLTTLPTTTPPPEEIPIPDFEASIKMTNEEYKPAMNDTNSTEFAEAAHKVQNQTDDFYLNSDAASIYNGSQVVGFSAGSLVANIIISFLDKPKEPSDDVMAIIVLIMANPEKECERFLFEGITNVVKKLSTTEAAKIIQIDKTSIVFKHRPKPTKCDIAFEEVYKYCSSSLNVLETYIAADDDHNACQTYPYFLSCVQFMVRYLNTKCHPYYIPKAAEKYFRTRMTGIQWNTKSCTDSLVDTFVGPYNYGNICEDPNIILYMSTFDCKHELNAVKLQSPADECGPMKQFMACLQKSYSEFGKVLGKDIMCSESDFTETVRVYKDRLLDSGVPPSCLGLQEDACPDRDYAWGIGQKGCFLSLQKLKAGQMADKCRHFEWFVGCVAYTLNAITPYKCPVSVVTRLLLSNKKTIQKALSGWDFTSCFDEDVTLPTVAPFPDSSPCKDPSAFKYLLIYNCNESDRKKRSTQLHPCSDITQKSHCLYDTLSGMGLGCSRQDVADVVKMYMRPLFGETAGKNCEDFIADLSKRTCFGFSNQQFSQTYDCFKILTGVTADMASNTICRAYHETLRCMSNKHSNDECTVAQFNVDVADFLPVIDLVVPEKLPSTYDPKFSDIAKCKVAVGVDSDVPTICADPTFMTEYVIGRICKGKFDILFASGLLTNDEASLCSWTINCVGEFVKFIGGTCPMETIHEAMKEKANEMTSLFPKLHPNQCEAKTASCFNWEIIKEIAEGICYEPLRALANANEDTVCKHYKGIVGCIQMTFDSKNVKCSAQQLHDQAVKNKQFLNQYLNGFKPNECANNGQFNLDLLFPSTGVMCTDPNVYAYIFTYSCSSVIRMVDTTNGCSNISNVVECAVNKLKTWGHECSETSVREVVKKYQTLLPDTYSGCDEIPINSTCPSWEKIKHTAVNNCKGPMDLFNNSKISEEKKCSFYKDMVNCVKYSLWHASKGCSAKDIHLITLANLDELKKDFQQNDPSTCDIFPLAEENVCSSSAYYKLILKYNCKPKEGEDLTFSFFSELASCVTKASFSMNTYCGQLDFLKTVASEPNEFSKEFLDYSNKVFSVMNDKCFNAFSSSFTNISHCLQGLLFSVTTSNAETCGNLEVYVASLRCLQSNQKSDLDCSVKYLSGLIEQVLEFAVGFLPPQTRESLKGIKDCNRKVLEVGDVSTIQSVCDSTTSMANIVIKAASSIQSTSNYELCYVVFPGLKRTVTKMLKSLGENCSSNWITPAVASQIKAAKPNLDFTQCADEEGKFNTCPELTNGSSSCISSDTTLNIMSASDGEICRVYFEIFDCMKNSMDISDEVCTIPEMHKVMTSYLQYLKIPKTMPEISVCYDLLNACECDITLSESTSNKDMCSPLYDQFKCLETKMGQCDESKRSTSLGYTKQLLSAFPQCLNDNWCQCGHIVKQGIPNHDKCRTVVKQYRCLQNASVNCDDKLQTEYLSMTKLYMDILPHCDLTDDQGCPTWETLKSTVNETCKGILDTTATSPDQKCSLYKNFIVCIMGVYEKCYEKDIHELVVANLDDFKKEFKLSDPSSCDPVDEKGCPTWEQVKFTADESCRNIMDLLNSTDISPEVKCSYYKDLVHCVKYAFGYKNCALKDVHDLVIANLVDFKKDFQQNDPSTCDIGEMLEGNVCKSAAYYKLIMKYHCAKVMTKTTEGDSTFSVYSLVASCVNNASYNMHTYCGQLDFFKTVTNEPASFSKELVTYAGKVFTVINDKCFDGFPSFKHIGSCLQELVYSVTDSDAVTCGNLEIYVASLRCLQSRQKEDLNCDLKYLSGLIEQALDFAVGFLPPQMKQNLKGIKDCHGKLSKISDVSSIKSVCDSPSSIISIAHNKASFIPPEASSFFKTCYNHLPTLKTMVMNSLNVIGVKCNSDWVASTIVQHSSEIKPDLNLLQCADENGNVKICPVVTSGASTCIATDQMFSIMTASDEDICRIYFDSFDCIKRTLHQKGEDCTINELYKALKSYIDFLKIPKTLPHFSVCTGILNVCTCSNTVSDLDSDIDMCSSLYTHFSCLESQAGQCTESERTKALEYTKQLLKTFPQCLNVDVCGCSFPTSVSLPDTVKCSKVNDKHTCLQGALGKCEESVRNKQIAMIELYTSLIPGCNGEGKQKNDPEICSNQTKLLDLITQGVCQDDVNQIKQNPTCSHLTDLFNCGIKHFCHQGIYCGTEDFYKVVLKNKDLIKQQLNLDVNTCQAIVTSPVCSDINIYNCLEGKCHTTSSSVDPNSCKYYTDSLKCIATELVSHGYSNCTSTNMLTSLQSSTGILPEGFDIKSCSDGEGKEKNDVEICSDQTKLLGLITQGVCQDDVNKIKQNPTCSHLTDLFNCGIKHFCHQGIYCGTEDFYKVVLKNKDLIKQQLNLDVNTCQAIVTSPVCSDINIYNCLEGKCHTTSSSVDTNSCKYYTDSLKCIATELVSHGYSNCTSTNMLTSLQSSTGILPEGFDIESCSDGEDKQKNDPEICSDPTKLLGLITQGVCQDDVNQIKQNPTCSHLTDLFNCGIKHFCHQGIYCGTEDFYKVVLKNKDLIKQQLNLDVNTCQAIVTSPVCSDINIYNCLEGKCHTTSSSVDTNSCKYYTDSLKCIATELVSHGYSNCTSTNMLTSLQSSTGILPEGFDIESCSDGEDKQKNDPEICSDPTKLLGLITQGVCQDDVNQIKQNPTCSHLTDLFNCGIKHFCHQGIYCGTEDFYKVVLKNKDLIKQQLNLDVNTCQAIVTSPVCSDINIYNCLEGKCHTTSSSVDTNSCKYYTDSLKCIATELVSHGYSNCTSTNMLTSLQSSTGILPEGFDIESCSDGEDKQKNDPEICSDPTKLLGLITQGVCQDDVNQIKQNPTCSHLTDLFNCGIKHFCHQGIYCGTEDFYKVVLKNKDLIKQQLNLDVNTCQAIVTSPVCSDINIYNCLEGKCHTTSSSVDTNSCKYYTDSLKCIATELVSHGYSNCTSTNMLTSLQSSTGILPEGFDIESCSDGEDKQKNDPEICSDPTKLLGLITQGVCQDDVNQIKQNPTCSHLTDLFNCGIKHFCHQGIYCGTEDFYKVVLKNKDLIKQQLNLDVNTCQAIVTSPVCSDINIYNCLEGKCHTTSSSVDTNSCKYYTDSLKCIATELVSHGYSNCTSTNMLTSLQSSTGILPEGFDIESCSDGEDKQKNDPEICSDPTKLLGLITQGVCQDDVNQIKQNPTCSHLTDLFNCGIKHFCHQGIYCGTEDFYKVVLKNKDLIKQQLNLDVNTCQAIVTSPVCSDINIYNCLEGKCHTTSSSVDPNSCKYYTDSLKCIATELVSHGYSNCTSTNMLTSLQSSTGILPEGFDIKSCSDGEDKQKNDPEICSDPTKLLGLITQGVCQDDVNQIKQNPTCSHLTDLFNCGIKHFCHQGIYCGTEDFYKVVLKNKDLIKQQLNLDVNTCQAIVTSPVCSDINIYNCLEGKCHTTSSSVDPDSCKYYTDSLKCIATELVSHGYSNCTSTNMLTSLQSSTGILPEGFDIKSCSDGEGKQKNDPEICSDSTKLLGLITQGVCQDDVNQIKQNPTCSHLTDLFNCGIKYFCHQGIYCGTEDFYKVVLKNKDLIKQQLNLDVNTCQALVTSPVCSDINIYNCLEGKCHTTSSSVDPNSCKYYTDSLKCIATELVSHGYSNCTSTNMLTSLQSSTGILPEGFDIKSCSDGEDKQKNDPEICSDPTKLLGLITQGVCQDDVNKIKQNPTCSHLTDLFNCGIKHFCHQGIYCGTEDFYKVVLKKKDLIKQQLNLDVNTCQAIVTSPVCSDINIYNCLEGKCHTTSSSVDPNSCKYYTDSLKCIATELVGHGYSNCTSTNMLTSLQSSTGILPEGFDIKSCSDNICSDLDKLTQIAQSACVSIITQLAAPNSSKCKLLSDLFSCVSTSLCSKEIYCADQDYFNLFKKNKVKVQEMLKLDIDTCDALVFVNPCEDLNAYLCLDASCPTTSQEVNCDFYKQKIDCTVKKLTKYNCTKENVMDLISKSPNIPSGFNVKNCQ